MRRILGSAVVCVGLLAVPTQGRAQAGLSLVGLGRSESPTDARIRALGGAGVVAHGPNFSLLNPAAVSRLTTSGALLTVSTEDRDVEGDRLAGDVRGTRFPVGQVQYPFAERWVAAVGFGAFLDQDWLVSFEDTLVLAEDSVPFTEDRSSSGGITHLRGSLSWAARDGLVLGLGLDLYSGDVTRQVVRRFDDPGAALSGYRDRARWEYRAYGLTVGALVVPHPDILVGGSVSWSGDLRARRDSIAEEREFPMPLRFLAGGSWRVGPELTWLVSVGFATWSRMSDALPEGAGDTWSLGTGVEYTFARTERSLLMVRAGYRRGTLPFKSGGAGGAPTGERGSEFAWTMGAGGRFAGGLAALDVALEIGRRGDRATLGLEESFRRLSFAISVYQPAGR